MRLGFTLTETQVVSATRLSQTYSIPNLVATLRHWKYPVEPTPPALLPPSTLCSRGTNRHSSKHIAHVHVFALLRTKSPLFWGNFLSVSLQTDVRFLCLHVCRNKGWFWRANIAVWSGHGLSISVTRKKDVHRKTRDWWCCYSQVLLVPHKRTGNCWEKCNSSERKICQGKCLLSPSCQKRDFFPGTISSGSKSEKVQARTKGDLSSLYGSFEIDVLLPNNSERYSFTRANFPKALFKLRETVWFLLQENPHNLCSSAAVPKVVKCRQK